MSAIIYHGFCLIMKGEGVIKTIIYIMVISLQVDFQDVSS